MGYGGSIFLISQGTSKLFSVVVVPGYILSAEGFLFSLHPHRHLLFVDFWVIAILTEV